MAVPASLYAAFVLSLGRADELMRGWAIPCATDIAFSYLVARLICG
jgi:NhaA family Na+:H+ antiporter